MAGYSGTPLAKKLGIKPRHRVVVLNAPKDFEISDLPEDVTITDSLRGKSAIDVALIFSKDEKTMISRFEMCVDRLTPAGGIWIAWPKKSSKVATDLSDSVVRAYGLSTGLVDNKVCAIDETWSGLRFVIRKEQRLGK